MDDLQPLFAAIAKGNPETIQREGDKALKRATREAKLIRALLARYEDGNGGR